MTKFEFAGPPRYAHQITGLHKLIETGGVGALLWDPGTAKTATVLDYASLLALKSPTGEARVLVVAPLAAVDTWVLQAAQFVSHQVNLWAEAIGGSLLERAETLASRGGQPTRGTPATGPRNAWQGPRAAHHQKALTRALRGSPGAPEPLPAEGPDGLGGDKPRLVLEITNIDTFSRRDPVGSKTMADVMMEAVRRFAPDLVVVDESHKIKSAGGNASRLLGRIATLVRRRILLTGTVMPHSPLDVYGQWRFLDPYAFGTRLTDGTIRQATFNGFRTRYAVMGGWMGKEVLGYRYLDEMQEIMARRATVVRKEDALDLPRTTTVTVPVHLGDAERSAYAQMAGQLAATFAAEDGSGTITTTNRLTQMMRLRQITSGFVPDDTGATRRIGRAKADTIASIVHDNLAGEKRIVIFAFFTHEIELLRRTLAAPDTEIMTTSGATSVEDRVLMRKRFGTPVEDLPQRIVMIAQIKTMSLAVNELVTASHAIFASLSQQRDDLIQAEDRLDRIGQTRPVTFWYALAPGTVDEVIKKSMDDRTDLETAMLEHVRRFGNPADSAA